MCGCARTFQRGHNVRTLAQCKPQQPTLRLVAKHTRTATHTQGFGQPPCLAAAQRSSSRTEHLMWYEYASPRPRMLRQKSPSSAVRYSMATMMAG